MKGELVYWEENDEVLVAKLPRSIIREILSTKPCGEWVTKEDMYGREVCSLHATPMGLFLSCQWKPAPGYRSQSLTVRKISPSP
ncbi:MAG: hypothetical protein QXJ59_09840 [Thermofilaceae archaeon]